MAKLKADRLNEMEQFARREVQERKRHSSSVVDGDVEVIAQQWRSNPPSGVVREHVRVSYKLAGKRISRSALLAALSA